MDGSLDGLVGDMDGCPLGILDGTVEGCPLGFSLGVLVG
jgi:hypothetical protein